MMVLRLCIEMIDMSPDWNTVSCLSDLAPGNDEIYEEKQETFMTVGNPQDGQVVLYKVGIAPMVHWYIIHVQ